MRTILPAILAVSVVAGGCGSALDESLDALIAAATDAGTPMDAGVGGTGGGTAGTGGTGGGTPTGCEGPRPTAPACLYDVPYECVNGRWQCGATPLVLSFDGAPVRFTSSDARFDLTGSGGPTPTDWPTAATPWLALDRNRNGVIDDATELFGSAVRLADGRRAAHGFEALAELDDDRNGQLDARDRRFAELVVWADRDGDRATGRGELRPARFLISISLEYRVAPACDARGNCGVERAAFTWADARGRLRRGEVVDVHLPVR